VVFQHEATLPESGWWTFTPPAEQVRENGGMAPSSKRPDIGSDIAFDPGFAGDQVAAGVRANAERWPSVLARTDVRVRPQPQVWSALEYGCHVRDVCRLFESRVYLMLTEFDPAFENWDQDARAIENAYGLQDPALVTAELTSSARSAAAAFDAVGKGDWQRSGRRSNGSVFTIETLGQYFLHDLVHHLHDVRG